jgi:RNA 2',3'-cyclic 3'-phosphodiesterase
MSDTRRLFFALWPDDALRFQLSERTGNFISELACRPVAPDNLHVTLAFVGSVPAQQVATLVGLGHALNLAPCELVFDQWTVWKQAGVLVLTASTTPPALQQLMAELRRCLNAAGYTLDTRPFQPHVTVARKVRAPRDGQIAPLHWPASNFVLVESLSTTAGVQYRVLATFAS